MQDQSIPSLPGGSWPELERAFRLTGHLQEGRMNSHVYKGLVGYMDPKTGQQGVKDVALKVVPYHEKEWWRMEREIDMLRRCQHPRVVQLIAHIIGQNRYAIALELCLGDMCDVVRARGGASDYQVTVEFREIAMAVHYLHSIKVAHLDLKLENILCHAERGLVLTDFEFARSFANGEMLETAQGTVYYSAPELFRPRPFKLAMAPLDVYALGVILYALHTGTMPFEGINEIDTIRLIVSGAYAPADCMDPAMQSIMEACLNRDPEQRPTSDQLFEWFDERYGLYLERDLTGAR